MQNNSFRERIGKISPKSTASFFRKRTYLVALLFCLPVGAIYFYCAVHVTANIFAPTWENYYTYLLDAFLHGRTNIASSNNFDLSEFENRWYFYAGPAPVLFVFPFYLLFHAQASDMLYTIIGSIANVALFYFVMQEFKKCFQISLSLMAEAFLVLSFGLASPNFLLSLTFATTYTVQIFATTYLLLFYLLYFRFLNSNKHFQLILCAVFFCLAYLSRYSLLFNGILFLYLLLYCKRSGRAIPRKIILFLALLILAFVSLEALYNFVRFHNVLETGLRFQFGPAKYHAILENNQILSMNFLTHNIYYLFMNNVQFSLHTLSIKIDTEGNSVFSVYPALLILPGLFCKIRGADKKRLSFFITAGIVIGLNLLLIILYFSTGWMQFGYRYFFDVIPLIFLLLMFVLPSVPMLIQMGLLGYGIFVNFYGIMAFYSLPTDNSRLQATFFWIVLLLSIPAFFSSRKPKEVS